VSQKENPLFSLSHREKAGVRGFPVSFSLWERAGVRVFPLSLSRWEQGRGEGLLGFLVSFQKNICHGHHLGV
jgi:hypothetical protein